MRATTTWHANVKPCAIAKGSSQSTVAALAVMIQFPNGAGFALAREETGSPSTMSMTPLSPAVKGLRADIRSANRGTGEAVLWAWARFRVMLH